MPVHYRQVGATGGRRREEVWTSCAKFDVLEGFHFSLIYLPSCFKRVLATECLAAFVHVFSLDEVNATGREWIIYCVKQM